MELFVPGPGAILELVGKIRNAMKLDGENKKDCIEITNRVEIVSLSVEEVQRAPPAVLQKKRMKKALSGTQTVLKDALEAIKKLQNTNTFTRVFSAEDHARHLDDLKEKITFWGDQIHKATVSHQNERYHAEADRRAQVDRIARAPDKHPNPSQPSPQVDRRARAPDNHANPGQPSPQVARRARAPDNHRNPSQPSPRDDRRASAPANSPNPSQPSPHVQVARRACAPDNHRNPSQPSPQDDRRACASANNPNPSQPSPQFDRRDRAPDNNPNPSHPSPLLRYNEQMKRPIANTNKTMLHQSCWEPNRETLPKFHPPSTRLKLKDRGPTDVTYPNSRVETSETSGRRSPFGAVVAAAVTAAAARATVATGVHIGEHGRQGRLPLSSKSAAGSSSCR